MKQIVDSYSLFTDFDIELFKAGKHFRLYEKMGAHTIEIDGKKGVYFAVWAPNALSVSVIGNFNGWNPHSHALHIRWDHSGIWEGVIWDIGMGEIYKYHIISNQNVILEKSDPFGLQTEKAPQTASIISTTWYEWDDAAWMQNRKEKHRLDRPVSIYEVHLASWMRDIGDPSRLLNYAEIAEKLVPYVKEMGFTHVELMPIMEFPYEPSWGYQITGYFAASSKLGHPQQLMYLIEALHKADIGVILDWVPSHFPGDANGLWKFDGTFLFEHEDPRQGFHPDWKSYIFNYGRNEVRSFLISNALFWLDRYHIDGLRVDAVASMLYLDYSRNEGEWIPNNEGGRENNEAVYFLKEFNEAVYANYPDIQTIAEESTSWPMVSKPTFEGGLGFGMKWMMGWMHDTLSYFKEDPLNRKHHQDKLTFSLLYAYSEHFMLPLSHDEVVHGKQSLIYKMPGDEWQKFANLRALYAYMYTFLGTKLLFMGSEFAQTSEWNFSSGLDWHLLAYAPHQGMQKFVSQLNKLYRSEPALYEKAFSPEGFEWVEIGDHEKSVLIYMRKGHDELNDVLVVLNLTPVVRENYRIGVPHEGIWEVLLNSDDKAFYGSGIEIPASSSEDKPWMNKEQSIEITLPPLAVVVLKCNAESYAKHKANKIAKTTEKTKNSKVSNPTKVVKAIAPKAEGKATPKTKVIKTVETKAKVVKTEKPQENTEIIENKVVKAVAIKVDVSKTETQAKLAVKPVSKAKTKVTKVVAPKVDESNVEQLTKVEVKPTPKAKVTKTIVPKVEVKNIEEDKVETTPKVATKNQKKSKPNSKS